MATLLLVLAATAAVVFLLRVVRHTPSTGPLPGHVHDHEMERRLANLRATRAYREDPPLFG